MEQPGGYIQTDGLEEKSTVQDTSLSLQRKLWAEKIPPVAGRQGKVAGVRPKTPCRFHERLRPILAAQ